MSRAKSTGVVFNDSFSKDVVTSSGETRVLTGKPEGPLGEMGFVPN